MGALIRRFHSPIYGLRLQGLLDQIMTLLQEGDRVLDVGCGSGLLGRAIMESKLCPSRVQVTGLEKIRRDGGHIPIDYYDGNHIPYPDHTYEIVILADVLHHESHPQNLLEECARVAKRLIVIKDHKKEGLFAQYRIALMDWVSNAPYGIPCLYRYNTAEEWANWYIRHGLLVEREMQSMDYYPLIMNYLFGGRIQYFAILRPNGSKESNS